MNDTLKQIMRNMLTGWGAIAARAVIALILVPFLLRQLGTDGYGLVGLLGVVLSLSQIADLGLRQALGRELAEHVARDNTRGFNELANTALILYLGIALVLSAFCWFLAPSLVVLFKVPTGLEHTAITALRIYCSLSIILSFVTPVFMAGLTSHHRFDLVNSAQIIGSLFSSAMLFVVLPAVEQALYGWVAVMLVHQAVACLLGYILHRRYCSHATFRLRFINLKCLKPLFHLGGFMYALQMTRTLSERSDPLVISFFLGPGPGVALYQPGGRLSQVIRPVVLTMADQMYPLTTKQHVERQEVKMRKILVLGTKYTLLAGALFCTGMLVFAEPFCKLWLSKVIGQDYMIAAKVMMAWAIVDLMTYAAGTQWSVLLGMKKLKFLVWTLVPTAILNVLVSIYLVGFTKLGIPGVLLATILIGVIRRPILIWHLAKVCHMKPTTYLMQSYARPILCLAITLLGACLIRFIMEIDSYLLLGTAACMVTAIWCLVCWFVGLDAKERKHVVAVIAKHRRKVHAA